MDLLVDVIADVHPPPPARLGPGPESRVGPAGLRQDAEREPILGGEEHALDPNLADGGLLALVESNPNLATGSLSVPEDSDPSRLINDRSLEA